ncbi:acyltransferase family protein [Pandoraea communis]|uniref:acyltransferase family protein n=1 Tax=Pandoraea communis TaxID=2508297 RepID=UPI0025A63BF3|nr:acyltransferase family protein [Pandoraea communis]MDM8357458.1 acyltransferase family protein [Pandoraea communis]
MLSPTRKISENTSLTYRRDIDGMRAVAILAVIIFHAFPTLLRSGFIGVDVFFVLSGFLITSIILKGLERGDFSFREFYAHRIKRIFPALVIVLVTSYAIGWFKLMPVDFKPLGMHIAAGATFIQNFVLWKEAGYFDIASELKPLMHLWSLAIEEQFYITYPVALYACWRARLNTLAVVILVLALSFIANIAIIGKHPIDAFFLPQTRIWELMAGGMLGHIMLHHRERMWRVATRILVRRADKSTSQTDDDIQIAMTSTSLLGALILAIGFATISPGVLFPGWWAIAPVLGTVLLLASGPTAWVNRCILSNDVMVFIGKISYPLYLWHWPALSIMRLVEGLEPSPWMRVAAITASFAAAYITYALIERPIRYGRSKKFVTPTLIVLTIVIAYFGYDAYRRDGLSFRPISRQFQEYSKIANVYEYFRYEKELRSKICHAVSGKTALANGCIANPQQKSIMIWGDSFAAALYPGLFNIVTKHHSEFAISQLTDGNGPPFTGESKGDSGQTLTQDNQDRLEALRLSKPDIVLITWLVFGQNAIEDKAHAMEAFSKTVAQIRDVSPKSRIVVIGSVPVWRSILLKQILEYAGNSGKLPPKYMKSGLDPRPAEWDVYMRDYLPKIGVQYISALEQMCNSDGCLTRLSDDPNDMTAIDWGHLSAAGSTFLLERLDAEIFKK